MRWPKIEDWSLFQRSLYSLIGDKNVSLNQRRLNDVIAHCCVWRAKVSLGRHGGPANRAVKSTGSFVPRRETERKASASEASFLQPAASRAVSLCPGICHLACFPRGWSPNLLPEQELPPPRARHHLQSIYSSSLVSRGAADLQRLKGARQVRFHPSAHRPQQLRCCSLPPQQSKRHFFFSPLPSFAAL